MNSQPSTVTERVLEHSGTILFFTFLASPFGYLIRIILSRSLQPEEYGLFYAMVSSFTLFTNYLDLGFGTAALYYLPKYWVKKEFHHTWLTFVYTSAIELASAIVVGFLALLLNNWLSVHYFKSSYSVELLPLFVAVLVLESITLCFKRLFIGLNKVRYYSSFEPLRFGVAFLAVGYLFLTGQTSVLAFSTAWLLSYLVTVLFCLLLFMSSFRHLLDWPKWNPSLFSQLKVYALPSLVNNFFNQLNTSTDVIFLTLINGVSSVGIYNVTFPVLIIPSMLFLPITRMFFPLLSTLQDEKNGSHNIARMIESVLKIVPLITLYFHVFIFLFAEVTLATLFTYKWVELAQEPLMWMAVFYLASILSAYLGFMLDGLGMMHQKVKMLSTVAVLNIIATIPAIYFFNVIGLIVVNGVVQFFLVAFYLKLLKSRYDFKVPYNLYAKYLAFFGLIGLLTTLIQTRPTTFMEFILVGVGYTILVAIFGFKQNLLAGYHKKGVAVVKR